MKSISILVTLLLLTAASVADAQELPYGNRIPQGSDVRVFTHDGVARGVVAFASPSALRIQTLGALRTWSLSDIDSVLIAVPRPEGNRRAAAMFGALIGAVPGFLWAYATCDLSCGTTLLGVSAIGAAAGSFIGYTLHRAGHAGVSGWRKAFP